MAEAKVKHKPSKKARLQSSSEPELTVTKTEVPSLTSEHKSYSESQLFITNQYEPWSEDEEDDSEEESSSEVWSKDEDAEDYIVRTSSEVWSTDENFQEWHIQLSPDDPPSHDGDDPVTMGPVVVMNGIDVDDESLSDQSGSEL